MDRPTNAGTNRQPTNQPIDQPTQLIPTKSMKPTHENKRTREQVLNARKQSSKTNMQTKQTDRLNEQLTITHKGEAC
jgi:hypothetical protein